MPLAILWNKGELHWYSKGPQFWLMATNFGSSVQRAVHNLKEDIQSLHKRRPFSCKMYRVMHDRNIFLGADLAQPFHAYDDNFPPPSAQSDSLWLLPANTYPSTDEHRTTYCKGLGQG